MKVKTVVRHARQALSEAFSSNDAAPEAVDILDTLKKEHDAASKERLQTLERELAELKERSAEMKARWQNEVKVIKALQSLKEELEQKRQAQTDAERSGEMFNEAHDFIVQAWTRPGPWRYEGKHFHYRHVNPWALPYQKPHPPRCPAPSRDASDS